MRLAVGLLLAGLCALAAGGATQARPAGGRGTVTIAAASDLQVILPQLIARFEKTSGYRTIVSFGSSGNFFAQIQNGAPFDVFLSADVDYPRKLVESRHGDADSLYAYATGRLVLWARTDSGLDVGKGLATLRDPRVRRIAIANPNIAPYGRAAVAALQSEHLYDQIKPRLVQAENIAQTAQLVESGNVDVGLISHSLALGPALQRTGIFHEISTRLYPPIVQAAVLVSASKNREAGRALLEYLKSADARQLFEAGGFGPPPQR
jgi:molybdate transport system substrate-binding protein